MNQGRNYRHMKEINQMSIEELQCNISKLEEQLEGRKGHVFCPNHELEIYLYEYYEKEQQENILNQPLHRLYYELALKQKEKNQTKQTLESFQQAHQYNPTDLEIMASLARVYYNLEDMKQMRRIIDQMYPYIYTSKDLAQYYSLLGSYYLETYQPEFAEALAMYSNLYHENKQTEIDLAFIQKAVGRKLTSASVQELQAILEKQGIPLQPKQQTLGILYHVAKRVKSQGNLEYARQLLILLYQLTRDKEVADLITELKKEER